MRWPARLGTRVSSTVLIAFATATLASAVSTKSASAVAPPGFVGINAEDVYAGNDTYQQQMLGLMQANGITEIRQIVRWRYTEPQRGVFDWAQLDRLMIAAAEHHIRVLLLLGGETDWATSRPSGNTDRCLYPPRNNQDFADWVSQVVARYGRGGQLWQQRPDLAQWALNEYEIWNEPDKPAFWACKPNAAAYVQLARAAAAAVRARDPQATIISAGMPRATRDLSQQGKYLRGMFRAGALKVFNALGVHPYAATAGEVVSDTKLARRLINKYGAKKWTIYVTEIGWATGGPSSSYTFDEAKQAQLVKSTYVKFGKLRKKLKLKSVDYYTWHDLPPPVDFGGGADYWGLHTGLLRNDDTVKPSLAALQQASQQIH